MTAVRILVADDHDVVRRGVRAILEAQPGWEVCDEAATGREAVEKAQKLKPDIVILDISMPELNGLEATRQILKEVPRTEVLILTIHASEQLMHDALQAGARGYVLKCSAGSDLVAAVKSLLRHEPFLTSKASGMVLEGYLKASPRANQDTLSHSRLSPREREIVQLLAEGKSNKEVAAALGISLKTAETHRANSMRKLNLHSVGELVRYAIRNKFIEP